MTSGAREDDENLSGKTVANFSQMRDESCTVHVPATTLISCLCLRSKEEGRDQIRSENGWSYIQSHNLLPMSSVPVAHQLERFPFLRSEWIDYIQSHI